jgi:Amt family ammonium transporter
VLYKFTDFIIPLRVSEEQEEIGLDLSQHGEVMQGEMLAPAPPHVFARTA